MGNCGYGTYYTDGEDYEIDEDVRLLKKAKREQSFKDKMREGLNFKKTHTLKFGRETIDIDDRYYKVFNGVNDKVILLDGDSNIVKFINYFIQANLDNPSTHEIIDKMKVENIIPTDDIIVLIINAINFIHRYNVDFITVDYIPDGLHTELEYSLIMYLYFNIDNAIDTIIYLHNNNGNNVLDTITKDLEDLSCIEYIVKKLIFMIHHYSEYRDVSEKYRVVNQLRIQYENDIIEKHIDIDDIFEIAYPPFKQADYVSLIKLRTLIDFNSLGIQIFNNDFNKITQISYESYSVLNLLYTFENVNEFIIEVYNDNKVIELNTRVLPEQIKKLYIKCKGKRIENLIIPPETGYSPWAHITTLTCDSDIKSLNGIENYPNITYLNCSYNKNLILNSLPPNLKTLLAKNINNYKKPFPLSLEVLHINDHIDDFRYLTNLKELNCSSGILPLVPEGLESLTCVKCNLTEIDIPSTLKFLDCSNNSLENLKLPEGLQTLICSNNNLTTIICNKELKSLNCLNNYIHVLQLNEGLKELKYLNRGNSTMLVDLKIKYPISLETLSGDHVLKYNLEECINLKSLELSGYYEPMDDFSMFTKLISLKCTTNKFNNIILPEGLEVFECGEKSSLTSISCPESLKVLKVIRSESDSITIDLSRCINLEVIDFTYSRGISVLNLTNCIKLKRLKIKGLYLSLDLRKNINLKLVEYTKRDNREIIVNKNVIVYT